MLQWIYISTWVEWFMMLSFQSFIAKLTELSINVPLYTILDAKSNG